MFFYSPADSPAFSALIDAAEQAGFEREAVRELFWLINAHPVLISHRQVFRNIDALLDAPVFSSLTDSDGQWVARIPQWKSFCQWVDAKSDELAANPDLNKLDEKFIGRHPIVGEGVGRHAVVAAMWCTHESATRFPPDDCEEQRISWLYFCLQAQFLFSYIDGRARYTNLIEFEAHSDPDEFGRVPASTAGPALAVREFSLAVYAPLIGHIDSNQTPDKFVAALSALDIDDSMLGVDSEDSWRYLSLLQRYFRRYGQMRLGRRRNPSKRKATSSHGEGGRRRRHGYVNFHDIEGIYFKQVSDKPDDDDLPWSPATEVHFFEGGGGDDAPHGLTSEENSQHIFNLYHPKELQGAIRKLKYQRLALEMKGQHFNWDYSQLTSGEISQLLEYLNAKIKAYYDNPKNRQLAYQDLIASLMIKVMLYFGQPLSSASRLLHQCLGQKQQRSDSPTLIVQGSFEEQSITPVAWSLAAIMPDYRTAATGEVDDDQDEATEQGRPLAERLILPDNTELGSEICALLNARDRRNLKVFEKDFPTAQKNVRDLLNSYFDTKVTTEKIRNCLKNQCMIYGRDQSLVWVISSDSTEQNQPRMHYTQHGTDKVVAVYAKAIRHIAPRSSKSAVPESHVNSVKHWIGARFVASMATVKALISDLRAESRPKTDKNGRDFGALKACDKESRAKCHHAFTLYVWLWQSILTTMRAITQPSALMAHRKASKYTLTSLSDKEGRYENKSRLVEINQQLAEQFDNYQKHCKVVISQFVLSNDFRKKSIGDQVLFVFDKNLVPTSLSPGWIEEEFEKRNFFLPANFHRGFLRTELLTRGCASEVVDAFLGHANQGESPFSNFSSFDYWLYRSQLQKYLIAIVDDLELKVIHSRIGQSA